MSTRYMSFEWVNAMQTTYPAFPVRKRFLPSFAISIAFNWSSSPTYVKVKIWMWWVQQMHISEIITIFHQCIKKYMIMTIRQSAKVYLDHKITDPRLTSKSSPSPSSSSRVSPEKVGALFSICFKSEESPSSLVFPSNSWRLFHGVTVGIGSSMEPQSISSSNSDMV